MAKINRIMVKFMKLPRCFAGNKKWTQKARTMFYNTYYKEWQFYGLNGTINIVNFCVNSEEG